MTIDEFPSMLDEIIAKQAELPATDLDGRPDKEELAKVAKEVIHAKAKPNETKEVPAEVKEEKVSEKPAESDPKLAALQKQIDILMAKLDEKAHTETVSRAEKVKDAKERAKLDLKVEEVEKLTREEERLEKELNKVPKSLPKEELVYIDEFKFNNEDWFNDDNPELVAEAIEIEKKYRSKYPTLTSDKIYSAVTKAIKAAHADRFNPKVEDADEEPKQTRRTQIAPGRPESRPTKDARSLTHVQRELLKQAAASGISMDADKYIKALTNPYLDAER